MNGTLPLEELSDCNLGEPDANLKFPPIIFRIEMTPTEMIVLNGLIIRILENKTRVHSNCICEKKPSIKNSFSYPPDVFDCNEGESKLFERLKERFAG